MVYLDLRNMMCPLPVLETEKMLESKDLRKLEVLIDNTLFCGNAKRSLESRGFAIWATQEADEYRSKGVREKNGVVPSTGPGSYWFSRW
jgi:TusA-related sulfurtransferase